MLLWAGIPQKKWSGHHAQQKSAKCSTWVQSQRRQNDLFSFARQTIQYHSNSSLCPNHWRQRSQSWPVEWIPTASSSINMKNRCSFHHRGWNAKVESWEVLRITGKFGLRVQNEAGQRLTEFCQENMLVTANTLFNNPRDDYTRGHHQMSMTKLTKWSIPKSDWLCSLQPEMEKLYTVSKNKT